MKTAEQWIQTFYCTHTVQSGDSLDDSRTMPPQEQWVKAIQIDALREAAEIARNSELEVYMLPVVTNLPSDSILARIKELQSK